MNRLFIVDPSLKDIRGHHYMMTLEATRSAAGLGYDVIWLCSAAFSNELDQKGAVVAPIFKASMYDAYIKQAKQAENPGLLSRLYRKLSGHRQPTPPPPTGGFYEDLKSALSQWDAGPQDRILLHTADGESLPVIARIVKETADEALPVFHMATPYDPLGVMPKKQGAEGFAETLEGLKAASKLNRKLFLYAENAYLAEHLSQVWRTNVRPLPIPASPAPPNAKTEARAALSKKLGVSDDSFNIISLGSARLEKGFHKIPEIADAAFAKAASIGGAEDQIKFILHASPQIVGRDPKITVAIEALQARPKGQVHLLLEPLSDDEYQALLHASDVILLPYGEHEYRVRGSAVVTEALAAGKTIVATANTYPGKAAKAHGGLTGDNPAELADAIITAYRERKHFREQAQLESQRFIDANKMETYWARCLEAERETSADA